MRILFACDYPHLPDNIGGLERNTHELCLALREAGHTPAVLSRLSGHRRSLPARLALKVPGNPGWAVHRGLGYKTFRCWDPPRMLRHAIEHLAPDVVVVQSWRLGMVATTLKACLPVLLYSHSANSAFEDDISDEFGSGWRDRCILLAASTYCAGLQQRALHADFGVLPPLIRPERFLATRRGGHLVQVGLNKAKGGDIALAIARARPDIPVLVVQGWPGLSPDPEDAALRSQAHALPNVRLVPSSKDPRMVYNQARVLLAPSRCNEVWGRVVSEAQLSGIPVVASTQGGLPESVGHGGCLVGTDQPTSRWVEAVASLWDDPAAWDVMSRRARERAALPDIAFASVRDRFLALLDTAVATAPFRSGIPPLPRRSPWTPLHAFHPGPMPKQRQP